MTNAEQANVDLIMESEFGAIRTTGGICNEWKEIHKNIWLCSYVKHYHREAVPDLYLVTWCGGITLGKNPVIYKKIPG